MKYFSEVTELNKILQKNQYRLDWRNNPDSISSKIAGTRELLTVLQEELGLTEIESHDTIKFQDNIQNSGLVYYFGDRISQSVSFPLNRTV